MTEEHRALLRQAADAGDPMEAFTALRAAFGWVEAVLSGDLAASRAGAIRACLPLAEALGAGGGLDERLEALLAAAMPGGRVSDALHDAQARLRGAISEVQRLAGEVAALERAEAELAERAAQARELTTRRDELARLQRLAADAGELAQQRQGVEAAIDDLGAVADAEADLAATAARLSALAGARIEAIRAETQRQLDEARQAADEGAAARAELLRQRQETDAQRESLATERGTLEHELAQAEARFEQLNQEHQAIVAALRAHAAADREVAEALGRPTKDHGTTEILQAVAEAEDRLGRIDTALRDALAHRAALLAETHTQIRMGG